jgi:hypothetical protein
MTPKPLLDWSNQPARELLAKQIERRKLQEALSDITKALAQPLAIREIVLDIQKGYLKNIAQLDADIAALQATLKP